MSVAISLRSWQAQFAQRLARHRGDDFLLVACPAAGKTIAAGAAVAQVMDHRSCDQLVVVCPTVVVRDQWATELGRLGYRMATDFDVDWPDHAHGVCATYAQVAQRAHLYEQACERRRTVAIFDEIHHVGSSLAWGEAIATGFAGARMRLMLSGTPFRSDEDRIPFVTYDDDGRCRPDYSYDYARAVRDGVCRPIRFRAHDGVITWREDGEYSLAAAFSEHVGQEARTRRLRASLDPDQPYLRSLLQAAHEDLLELRRTVPDAAGLVVCDTQAHALEIDRLLTEITGHLPVLAMSDVPRAHEAIAAFATESEEWLVSVRMVSEGVDIPRLAVIAWATAASTELLVRQVAGRALRSRAEYSELPAIVHIPADPKLVQYAERLDVLGGISVRSKRDSAPHVKKRRYGKAIAHKGASIDPGPFIAWFDQQAAATHGEDVLRRCGMDPEMGARRIYSWREGETWADALTIYDACHMAGISFYALYDGPEHQRARDIVDAQVDAADLDFGTIEAQPTGDAPLELVPPVTANKRPLIAAPEALEIQTPELPPSPEEIIAAEQARQELRSELFRMLGIYAQLRALIQPAYQLASAHRELTAELGPVSRESDDETVATALDWIRGRVRDLAERHPEHVRQLARERRRLAAA